MLDQTSVFDEKSYGNSLMVSDGADFILMGKESPQTLKTNHLHTISAANPLNWKSMIKKRLETSHTAVVTIYTIVAAFCAYFSIYGISSSLFAATFDGETVFGGKLELKVALSMAQTLGYAVSKVAGAIIIPTIKRNKRWPILVLLAVLGELPLLLFGVLPGPGKVVMVFISGLPTAWMWGIMVMYLEGRKTSEFLLMGLYLSVMVASGAAKSAARAVLRAGVPESFMPCLCGAVAAASFIFFVSLLDAIPDPSEEDKKEKQERRTITQAEARRFLLRWAPGLVLVTLIYAVLTAFRNFRDYFAPELWRDLEGPNFDPSRFSESEIPVGVCTALAYSLIYWIKDNKKAFFAILGSMFAGGLVILAATITNTSGLTDPLSWMIMIGVGLYMAYIPPGAMLYDRFNAATGNPQTSVFMIYLSDVCGYTITLSVLFYRNFGDANISYVDFFHSISYIAGIACMIGILLAGIYFMIAMRNLSAPATGALPTPTQIENGIAMKEIEEIQTMESQPKHIGVMHDEHHADKFNEKANLMVQSTDA